MTFLLQNRKRGNFMTFFLNLKGGIFMTFYLQKSKQGKFNDVFFTKIDKKEISWSARHGTVAHAGPHGTKAARGNTIDPHASSEAPAMGFGVSSGILAPVDEHSGRYRSCSGPKKRSDRAVVSSGVAPSRPTTTGGALTPRGRILPSQTRGF